MEIYASQYGVLTEVLAKTGLLAENIAAIGNLLIKEKTTILWDKETGRPVTML